jgi:ubiquitin
MYTVVYLYDRLAMPIPETVIIYKQEEGIMKRFVKRIFGLDKIEAATKEAESKLSELEAKRNIVEEYAKVGPLSPKERATKAKEPWVSVLATHVNKENIRNGFFELDWNEYFIVQLRAAGYTGDTEEAVVDQWFTELCRNVGSEEGIDMSRRGSGYINVNNLGNGRTEVS